MSPIQFKLSRPPDGLVRRVTFQERPSWETLAAKIESLFNIPLSSDLIESLQKLIPSGRYLDCVYVFAHHKEGKPRFFLGLRGIG